MRKVKKVMDRFIEIVDGGAGEVLKCCFHRNNTIASCASDCVACEIIDEDDKDIKTTVRCLRGKFTFAIIED